LIVRRPAQQPDSSPEPSSEVDEAHAYKNLRTVSNIPGAAIEGSRRAQDLHLKTTYLRERYGGHVATLATATPIANSVTEAHVMQRYLRPDLLADAGVEHFDAWAATFGQTVTEIEIAPTGDGSYRMSSRFARFQNVPEMLRIWHVFADVKTAEELDLPVPALAARPDGQRGPHTVVIDPSPELQAYVRELGEWAEKVRSRSVTPEEDNMLLITGDGRKAALDMRLATGQPAAGQSKLEIAAGRIAGIWQEHRHRPYDDPDTGERSPIPGALQIVFCDLGTPAADRWNAYDELREQLAARGVPRDHVRYIHDAKTDVEKGRLFAAARAGHVAVIVGSTEKMGVGTNIQARAIALHLLDCPWRPSDIEQRQGRILRQGNQNPEVGIYRYVVEGSFDAYSWQTVERKARFIAQVMRGRLDAREIEDIGDNTLSFAEVKALASGDPLVLEHARATAELTRLHRLERAWQRTRPQLRSTLTMAEQRADFYEREIANVAELLERRTDTRGDRFQITIDDATIRERKAAGETLAGWTNTTELDAGERPVAQLAGLQIAAKLDVDAEDGGRVLTLRVEGHPDRIQTHIDELRANPAGIIQRLENRARGLDARVHQLHDLLQQAIDERTRARQALAQPFKHADTLANAREHHADIEQQMRDREQQPAAEPPAPQPSSEWSIPARTVEPHQREAATRADGAHRAGGELSREPPDRVLER
jgi:hypothetical protein